MDRNRDFDEDIDEPQSDSARDAERIAADRANEDRADRERRPTTDEESADEDEDRPNPPRTTTGPITAPKFGSAGSGGAELDPGYPKN